MQQLAPQQNGSPVTMMVSDIDINPHERYAQLLEKFDHIWTELQQARNERDEARTELILSLHDLGYTVRGIAAEIGDISKTLVQNVITKNRPVIVPHGETLRVAIDPTDVKSWTKLEACENGHHLVYVFKDAEDQVLYVGVTWFPKYRWDEHKRNRPWWDQVVAAELTCFNTREEAVAGEREQILALNPAHNINGFGRKARAKAKAGQN